MIFQLAWKMHRKLKTGNFAALIIHQFYVSSMRIPDPDNQNPKFKHFFKKIDKIGVFSLLKNKKILSS